VAAPRIPHCQCDATATLRWPPLDFRIAGLILSFTFPAIARLAGSFRRIDTLRAASAGIRVCCRLDGDGGWPSRGFMRAQREAKSRPGQEVPS